MKDRRGVKQKMKDGRKIEKDRRMEQIKDRRL
jgi:hypothetical protein